MVLGDPDRCGLGVSLACRWFHAMHATHFHQFVHVHHINVGFTNAPSPFFYFKMLSYLLYVIFWPTSRILFIYHR